MSYPIQLYRASNDGDVFRSFFDLADRMMNAMLQSGSGSDGIS